ncbi:MAG: hypothetical protein AAF797_16685 [Planctomycetota bacterium]
MPTPSFPRRSVLPLLVIPALLCLFALGGCGTAKSLSDLGNLNVVDTRPLNGLYEIEITGDFSGGAPNIHLEKHYYLNTEVDDDGQIMTGLMSKKSRDNRADAELSVSTARLHRLSNNRYVAVWYGEFEIDLSSNDTGGLPIVRFLDVRLTPGPQPTLEVWPYRHDSLTRIAEDVPGVSLVKVRQNNDTEQILNGSADALTRLLREANKRPQQAFLDKPTFIARRIGGLPQKNNP